MKEPPENSVTRQSNPVRPRPGPIASSPRWCCWSSPSSSILSSAACLAAGRNSIPPIPKCTPSATSLSRSSQPANRRHRVLDRPVRPGGPELENLLASYGGLNSHLKVEKRTPWSTPTFVSQYATTDLEDNSLIVVSDLDFKGDQYDDIFVYDYSDYMDGGGYTSEFFEKSRSPPPSNY